MKAKQVLKILKITRPTLSKYVRLGKLKVVSLSNGFYDYDDESVYYLLNKNLLRKNVIYCRDLISIQELEKQKTTIKKFCLDNNIEITDVYSDIGSGMDFDRKDFLRLLVDISSHKISKVYIVSNDKLTKNSFDSIQKFFNEYNCEIVSLGEKSSEQEAYKELISFIQHFSKEISLSNVKNRLKNILNYLKMELKISDENCK